jgi:DNA-binding response OmpR family regulator
VPDTILIVEDEPDFAALVELWMSRAGYRTVLARTGHEALRGFYDDHPDLVILDVALPGLDGWQII